VTRTEERLADALHAAAESVRPGTLRPLTTPDTKRLRGADRASKRRRTWLVPVMAAAAVTAVTLAGVVVARQGGVTPSGPTGPPPYYVLTHSLSLRNGDWSDFVIEVRSTATGRVISTLKLPERLGAGNLVRVASVSAAADRRTFFVVMRGQAPGADIYRFHLEIYRFHLTATGHITRLTRVPGIPETGFGLTAVAASPDGSRLAIGGVLLRSYRRTLMIVNVASGRRTTWTAGSRAALPDDVGELSWTADGRTLAFVLTTWNRAVQHGYRYFDEVVRTVDANGRGGSLADSRVVFAQKASPVRSMAGAVISPDGRRVDVLALVGKQSKATGLPPNVQVTEVGVTQRASHPRLLYFGKAGYAGDASMVTDGFGHLALVTDGKIGWLDHGRIHPLAPGDTASLMDFSW
jgi:hypothetical protein